MKKLFCLFLLFVSVFSMAQESASYKLPPKEIADLLLAKPTPMVSIDHLGEWMLVMERESYPTVEELGQQISNFLWRKLVGGRLLCH